MQKKIVRIIMCFICLSLFGCQDKQQTIKKEEKLSEYDLLVNGYWSHYDPVIGEMENMSFNKDGEFFYCCSCGEPVDNSDLYDVYSYEENGKIKLKASYDERINEVDIDIIYIDENILLIQMKDDRIEFYNSYKIENLSDNYDIQSCDQCIAYFKDYDGYCTVTKIDKDIEISFIDDTSMDDFRHVSMSDDIQFYCLKADTVINDSGLVDQHQCSYKQLSQKEFIKIIDESSKKAFLWYDNQGKVIKVVLYDDTVKYK